MTYYRTAKIVRNNTPLARRPVGRQPKRWKDSWEPTLQELPIQKTRTKQARCLPKEKVEEHSIGITMEIKKL